MSAAARALSERTNPFKGPVPLQFHDKIYGREEEIREILSLLLAGRLVLMHSLSGCGKSSLIEAGIRPKIGEYRLQGLPTVRLASVAAAGKPANPLLESVYSSLQCPAPDGTEFRWPTRTPAMDLDTFLGGRPVHSGFDFLIFDQFEEVITTEDVTEEQRLEFFRQVGIAMENSSRWAIFAIREDYLGALEPYLRFLPTQLETRFRLQPLHQDQAAEAMVKLAKTQDVIFDNRAAKALAADLATGTQRVEPVYLQVACHYVWEHRSRSDTISSADIVLPESKSGESVVETALQKYYDEAIEAAAGKSEERQTPLRRWFSDELISISTSGERRRHAFWAEPHVVNAAALDVLLERYLIRRDDRNETWIELTHDRLIKPVLRSNAAWFKRLHQPWQDTAEAWIRQGRDRSLLSLCAFEVGQARDWAGKNPAKVTPDDIAFLRECEAENRNRRKLKWARIASYCAIVAAVTAFLIGLLKVREAGIATQNAKAKIAEAEQKVVSATKDAMRIELRARSEATHAEAEATRQRGLADKAKAELAAASIREKKILEVIESKSEQAAKAEKDAAAAKAQAADDTRRAAEDVRAAADDAARTRMDAQQRENEAKHQLSLSGVLQRVFGLLNRAQSDRNPGPALDALSELVSKSNELASFPEAETALKAAVDGLGATLSRATLVRQYTTSNLAQITGLDGSGDCALMITPAGTLTTVARGESPTNPCQGEAVSTLAPVSSGVQEFEVPTASALSQNGSRAGLGSALGSVAVSPLPTPGSPSGIQPRRFHALGHQVSVVALSPSGRYAAVAGSLWSFGVWDLGNWPAAKKSPRKLYDVPSKFHPIDWIYFFGRRTDQNVSAFALYEAFASGQPLLAAGRQDGSVAIYNLTRSKLLATPVGPWQRTFRDTTARPVAVQAVRSVPVQALAFSLDGSMLASGDRGGRVLLFQIPSSSEGWKGLRPKQSLQTCSGRALSLAFSPHNEFVAVGCQEGQVKLYDPTAAFPSSHTIVLDTSLGEVNTVVFDPHRRRLLTTGSRYGIEEWRLPTRTARERWEALERDLEQAKMGIDLMKFTWASTPAARSLVDRLKAELYSADTVETW